MNTTSICSFDTAIWLISCIHWNGWKNHQHTNTYSETQWKNFLHAFFHTRYKYTSISDYSFLLVLFSYSRAFSRKVHSIKFEYSYLPHIHSSKYAISCNCVLISICIFSFQFTLRFLLSQMITRSLIKHLNQLTTM